MQPIPLLGQQVNLNIIWQFNLNVIQEQQFVGGQIQAEQQPLPFSRDGENPLPTADGQQQFPNDGHQNALDVSEISHF